MPNLTLQIKGEPALLCVQSSDGSIYHCSAGLDTYTVPAGAQLTIIGYGSYGGSNFTFQYVDVEGQTLCPSGITNQSTVPYTMPSHDVTVTGYFSAPGSQRSCNPTPTGPQISVTPLNPTLGSSVKVTGAGFVPSSIALIYVNQGSVAQYSGQVDVGGNLVAVYVPITSSFTSGQSYQITAVDAPTGKTSNVVTITVGGAPPPPPTSYSISVTVNDSSTANSASGGQTLNAHVGDSITIQGVISPAPPSCSGCVDIRVVNAPQTGSIGKVGLGSLGPGNYLYGPATVPSGVSSFGIQTVYLPTNTASAVVTINVSTPPPPPPPVSPHITVSPTSANIGDNLTVNGSGFTPNSVATVFAFNGQVERPVQVNVNGVFAEDVPIGVTVLSGTYSVVAVDSTGAHSNMVQITVVAPPPPPIFYSCVGNQCVADPNGTYPSLAACQAVCQPPPPPQQRYSCVSGQCVQDANGQYSSLAACQSACSPPVQCTSDFQCPSGYHCVSGTCVPIQQQPDWLAIIAIGVAVALGGYVYYKERKKK